MKIKTQPIIIIGMHRSGTTMVAKMLQQLGLYIGWDLHSTRESNYFMKINEKILNICNGSWDNPTVIEKLLDAKPIRSQLTATIAKDIGSIHSIIYLNVYNYLRKRSLKNIDFPWGWKDPRNTFTLPIWLDIFNEAKIIHVYRNGIDVAKSLVVRENKRRQKLIQKISGANQQREIQMNQLKNKGTLLYLIKKIYTITEKSSPLSKYNKYRVYSADTIQKAFDLWNVYVDQAIRLTNTINNPVMNIKYEDFLLNPNEWLTQLKQFCELRPDDRKINEIAGTVNKDRRYAFKKDKELLVFYEQNKNNKCMQELKYDNII